MEVETGPIVPRQPDARYAVFDTGDGVTPISRLSVPRHAWSPRRWVTVSRMPALV
jgi:hypothetical protein